MIDGRKIKAGNRLLGLASSGFHSNGFSLLRVIFSEKELKGALGRELLRPTRIYVKPVLEVLKKIPVAGIVNITGGGFYDNLPRVLPKGLGAWIDSTGWPRPKLFELVRKRAKIPPLNSQNGGARDEMFRTFNMGIGMILILEKGELPLAQRVLSRYKISSWDIGEVIRRRGVRIQ